MPNNKHNRWLSHDRPVTLSANPQRFWRLPATRTITGQSPPRWAEDVPGRFCTQPLAIPDGAHPWFWAWWLMAPPLWTAPGAAASNEDPTASGERINLAHRVQGQLAVINKECASV
ncbi:hypothetical protein N658DRAFT_488138 [Parathielavia hyrcaniae]|uniref:Uncharacterized protein n=1 Tax=Parathielavia hyrcaniae TaxID=113614 RepID=A0AAN6PVL1_9PEZI|nr:hypothetical protein N658DRAFT_488138 [Parathielavia hyrcaniae]